MDILGCFYICGVNNAAVNIRAGYHKLESLLLFPFTNKKSRVQRGFLNQTKPDEIMHAETSGLILG